ncbi:hypothetical protein [Pelagicoccus sp. SDUM812005]|uniref:hypothetical protein n=1 Tax=Pelagicoccus sp. SDUM812005 TaxID=3041257 RepID=UPI00280F5C64|nr:hypothetical protein [Pelagicoccus sp. SDUM812005]MDQ8182040.1 hypothetical protein [Pelagicoccus sp. SDUM812005]
MPLEHADPPSSQALVSDLLQRWCEGMINLQIDDPSDSARHGALDCPGCGRIHGRCFDAVYPLFHMAKATGEVKYLAAGKSLFAWSKNVSQPDGSWTVMPDPNSWKGVTVFGAIALAKTLHYHGDLLDKAERSRWTNRLVLAANYVFENFDLTFANINYGFSAIYALHLLGRQLGEPRYLERSRELAQQAKRYFTRPHKLVYGEAKPTERLSVRGLPAVDLGYNVEESLNGLVLYALAENDTELLDLLEKSLASHLEFMLPDGGWDNSWGTRQFKWTYWGSRTSDGCQPAYLAMRPRNPAFATAALKNLELLKRCTSPTGLLYEGIHYDSHGLDPCIHHTFAHAKPLAYILDSGADCSPPATPLPRSRAYGIKSFPEIATHLAAIGPWRATITAYDFLYRPGVQQATGGSLSLLWHQKLGPLCAASMARYQLVEPHNQQAAPDDEDFPLTPRLEKAHNGILYSNLFDLKATVSIASTSSSLTFNVSTKLNNCDYQELPVECQLRYTFTNDSLEIQAHCSQEASFVLPILSPSSDSVSQTALHCIQINKAGGSLVLASSYELTIRHTKRDRTFNRVPGAQAVPIEATVPANAPLRLLLRVS